MSNILQESKRRIDEAYKAKDLDRLKLIAENNAVSEHDIRELHNRVLIALAARMGLIIKDEPRFRQVSEKLNEVMEELNRYKNNDR